jgi:AraC-like DNA-binding protein
MTRLFHAAVGKTIVGYVQERRAERARHLLAYTDLPIKTVAAQVGIEDLSRFNKTIRRWCGAPPRRVRETSPAHARIAAPAGRAAAGRREP